MQPSVCRTVMAVGVGAAANGTDVAPALITRVWSQRDDGAWCVNATVFPDASTLIRALTSAYLFDDEKAAREAVEENPHSTALFWPGRV